MSPLQQYSLFNPGPVQTADSVKAASIQVDMCHRSPQFSNLMLNVRHRLADLVQAPAEAVLIPGSATFALEAALISFTARNEHCLVLSNGTYGQRLIDICRLHERRITVLEWEMGGGIDLAAVNDVLDATGIDCLLFVHHETSSGCLNQIEILSKLAHDRGIKLIVDAVSSLGAETIDLRCSNWCLIGSANKCLESLPGLGFVLASQSMWSMLSDAPIYSLNLVKYLASQREGEVAFTPPVNAMLALDAALERFFDEGRESRRQRYLAALDRLDSAFTNLGMSRLVDRKQSACSLAVFSLPGISYPQLSKCLYDQGIVIYGAHPPLDRSHFRVSVMGYKSLDQLDHLIFAVTEAIRHAPC